MAASACGHPQRRKVQTSPPLLDTDAPAPYPQGSEGLRKQRS